MASGRMGVTAWLRNTSCSGGTGRSDRAEYIPFKYSLTDLGMEIFLFPAPAFYDFAWYLRFSEALLE